MNLKELQAQYRAGKLTKEQYLAKLKELLDGQDIDQKEYDEAKDFDPKDPDDEPKYSQREFDAQLLPAAVRKLRKELKAQGVDLDVNNKELLAKVVELAKLGQGKEPPKDSELAKEVDGLRKDAGKVPGLQAENTRLAMENAVFRVAGKYNPHNPARVAQTLLADPAYTEMLEQNDEGTGYTSKSLDRAIKRIAEAEPYLFRAADDETGGQQQRPGFSGKPPGGSANSGSEKDRKSVV